MTDLKVTTKNSNISGESTASSHGNFKECGSKFTSQRFLASPALAFQRIEKDFGLAAEPSSDNDQDIIPPELHYYLDECLKKLGTECGPMFFERIFVGEKNEIPTSCCQKLVQIGENCHNAITDAVISRPEFSANATLYHTKAAETWKMCSLL